MLGFSVLQKEKMEAVILLPSSQSIQFSIHVVVSPPFRRVRGVGYATLASITVIWFAAVTS